MFLADFHLHSRFSDGVLTISELVDLYGQRGFGAIAITDHVCESRTFLGKSAKVLGRTLTKNSFPAYLEKIREESDRAWRQYRMVLLPGFEVTKNSFLNDRSSHILGIGLEAFVSADQEPLTIARQIRSQGGLAIAAHPVHTGLSEPQTFCLWNNRHDCRYEFDAWEVASGPRLFREVLDSGFDMLASSDLHHPRHMTSWKTKMECERHPEAIMEAVRRQELDFVFYQDSCPQSLPASPIMSLSSLPCVS